MNAELIETMARAMCSADGCDPDEDWTTTPGGVTLSIALPYGERQRWRTYQRKAQAALQAIKDAGQAIVPNGVVDALATAESWLNTWGSHVGGCAGGSRCTCGLEAVSAEIGHAIYQASQPKTGEGT